MGERSLPTLVKRVWNTAVFWAWLVHAFRLGSGVLVMPLLLRKLGDNDLSIYWQFIFLAGIGYILDGMFADTVVRYVSYAMRGAADVQSLGLSQDHVVTGHRNDVLLSQLFSATRRLYRLMCLFILVTVGIFGTLLIYPLAPQSSNPTITWIAWVITITSNCLELYTGYWLVFLRGMNQVVFSTRLTAAIYGLKITLSVILLIKGLGLLAVPISALVTGLIQRLLARAIMKRLTPEGFGRDRSRDRDLLAKIWPTSWRMGVVGISANAMLVGFGSMISHTLGLQYAYRYQFSQQMIIAMCGNMSAVWTLVKWPTVMQLRIAHDFAGMRRLLWPRVWLQIITLVGACAFVIVAAQPAIEIIAPNKEILPRSWLIVMAVYVILETHYVFWTTLLTSENRIPSTWAAAATNVSSLVVAYALVKMTDLGLGAFVLAPLLTGVCFNHWHWARVGARSLGITWSKYMFKRPA